MIVVHMDSGLGNQMLDYAEYLAIKKTNPDQELYIETAIYDVDKSYDGLISQWNGYELDRVFGIKAPMVKDMLGSDAWNRLVDKLGKSRFWENNWRYAPVVVQAMADEGYNLRDCTRESQGNIQAIQAYKARPFRRTIRAFFQSEPGYHVKQALKRVVTDKVIRNEADSYNVYQRYKGDVYTGHSLAFRFKQTGLEKIDAEVREAFKFPEITDEANLKAMDMVRSCNSVAIHARRGDMLTQVAYCYKYGYFRKAVRFIKEQVENPVFFIFTDPGSMDWCRENPHIFGLDFDRDKVEFVTWNSGTESYRDMQLMSMCKHNIFTESSFGFWAAYLNTNPNKITIAPEPTWNTTNWF